MSGQGIERIPLISVQGVTHRFTKDVRDEHGQLKTLEEIALNQVELEVNPGELVILKGPSGCGKTTLLTLVGGLRRVQPNSGKIHIYFDRNSPLKLEELAAADSEQGLVELRKRIGFIFQRHNLLTSLTSLQNVQMAQNLYASGSHPQHDPEKLLRYLGLAGGYGTDEPDESRKLPDVRNKTQQEISGGQSQRVAIARALVNCPQLVLADEPTAALDHLSSNWVIELLRHLAHPGQKPPQDWPRWRQELLRELTPPDRPPCTSLVVTHDAKIVDLADRIVEMEKGRIVKNVIVAERRFLVDATRSTPAFAVFLPDELVDLADHMSVRLNLDRDLDKVNWQPPDPEMNWRTDPPEKVGTYEGKGVLEKYEANRVVLREGDPVEELDRYYVICQGKVAVLQNGKPEPVNTLEKGDWFGDVALIYKLVGQSLKRNATIRTLEPTILYTLTLRDLHLLVNRWNEKAAREGHNSIQASVRRFIQRMEIYQGQQYRETQG